MRTTTSKRVHLNLYVDKDVREQLERIAETNDRSLSAEVRLGLRQALVLDASGMRVGELEQLTWGDVDEPRGRWRVSAGVAKTGAARWVTAPPVLFDAVMALVPRDDRTPERHVFQGFGADKFRTSLTRACTAAGIPTCGPHDFRHRRVSLLHLGGMPWARLAEVVGHGDITTTSRVHTHVVADEAELDYEAVLA